MVADHNRRSKDDRRLTGKITRSIEDIMKERVIRDGGRFSILKAPAGITADKLPGSSSKKKKKKPEHFKKVK